MVKLSAKQNTVPVSLSEDMLKLIKHMEENKDNSGLMLLHKVLTTLILNNIIDTKTSFIDLSEYVESLANGDISSADKLKKLIDSDLKK